MVRTQADRHKPVLSHRAPPPSCAGTTDQEQPLERWQEDTASFFQDPCTKGGAHYLQGESCETTHLLIHYKTKTAPTRLYLILMFRLASYIVIKKTSNKHRKKHPFFLLPPKAKESNNNKKNTTPPPKPRNPCHNPEKKKSYSCGNPNRQIILKNMGSMVNLKNLLLEAHG